MTCHSQQNTTPTERMQHQPTGVAFSKLSRNEFIELFLEKAFMGDSQETSQTSHANSDEFLTMLSLPSEQQQMVNTNPVNDRTGISSHNYTLEDSLLLDDSNFMQNFREWLFLSQQMQSLQSYL
ncbi:hypothetical protein C9374_000502 [Naegleria lovaniensis]|uniref:Uncharacterized protein n=1 Tax=Naegleria lovaniensis TaxID=51637 RepID=A0AA88GXT5_NAELO|nr:uncharacterized protein C9374_000502 [Naegleria lovaniensis]KAG2388338.1 hypothetical protein C9374_000502 [Naegleria lovaniensis]